MFIDNLKKSTNTVTVSTKIDIALYNQFKTVQNELAKRNIKLKITDIMAKALTVTIEESKEYLK